MTLDQAQLAKKRLIAAKLLVRPGARVLDIGCGWGGMALYLARVCGADVTGVTLSQEQLRVATERAAAAGLADRVRFRLQDYREVDGHVRQHRLGRHVRARRPAAVPDLLPAPSRRLLAPDGVDAAARDGAARRRRPTTSRSSRSTSSPAATSRRSPRCCPAVERSRAAGPRHRDPVAALRRDDPGVAPALPRQPRAGARALRRAVHPDVGVLPRGIRERLPLRPHARLPPAARPRPGPRAGDPRLYSRRRWPGWPRPSLPSPTTPGCIARRRSRRPCGAGRHPDRRATALSCGCESVCVARSPCGGAVLWCMPVEASVPARRAARCCRSRPTRGGTAAGVRH